MSRQSKFFALVEAGDVPGVEGMLESEPSLVLARDETGATPLHVAAFHARRSIVKVLCDTGADLNARDTTYGATPAGWALHYLRELGAFLAIEIDDVAYAVANGDVAWCRRLLARHPAIIEANDASGRPLAELIRESPVQEIAQLVPPRVL